MKKFCVVSLAFLFVAVAGLWCGYGLGRSANSPTKPKETQLPEPKPVLGEALAEQTRLRRFEAVDLPLNRALAQLERQANETLLFPSDELRFRIVNQTLNNETVTIVLRDPMLISVLDLICEQTNLDYSIDMETCRIVFHGTTDMLGDESQVDDESPEDDSHLLPPTR